ncbi:MAG: hypothetical protein AB3N16_11375, partial [Flavobacteriaceae bacterium]
MDSITKQNFEQSLETLFSEIARGKIKDGLLTPHNAGLTKFLLQQLMDHGTKKEDSVIKTLDTQLINVYPVATNEHFISISFTNRKTESNPVLQYIINLMATQTKDGFTFSVPLDYFTRYWKTEKIGDITYHFRRNLNRERAEKFNSKNAEIAKKLGLTPEKLSFYMTDNFQEISELLGFGYSISSNGKYRDGLGVVSKTIFAVMNHEDFSHDIFHYYSGKIHDRSVRNWVVEEGMAYSWGNAYYTKKDGEMAEQEELIKTLKKYLAQNGDVNLLLLFENHFWKDKSGIFEHLAPDFKVGRLISSVICDAVYEKHGMQGINKLLTLGAKPNQFDPFFKGVNNLMGINRNNFNERVHQLLENRK